VSPGKRGESIGQTNQQQQKYREQTQQGGNAVGRPAQQSERGRVHVLQRQEDPLGTVPENNAITARITSLPIGLRRSKDVGVVAKRAGTPSHAVP